MKYRFKPIGSLIIIMLSYLAAGVMAQDNAIDLNGVSLKNASTPVSGLVTGGQPSQEDLSLLASKGIKNVVNLRGVGEFDSFDESQAANALKLNYIALPIEGANGVTLENAEKLDQIMSKLSGDTLLHCASGNRAGALLALRAALIQGIEIEKAIQLGKDAGMTSLESKTRAIIEAKLKH